MISLSNVTSDCARGPALCSIRPRSPKKREKDPLMVLADKISAPMASQVQQRPKRGGHIHSGGGCIGK
ncbi:hypothetical protein OUZ56_007708 [Daphnia magna]|uniref:Uncharacterized protein n=1 Tax=Daphnia magna TaxID=35525 RepID=A0ABR0AAX4_9CRUS|nr:hypothetical protein OUZ56_007708 [Daphnia magna]